MAMITLDPAIYTQSTTETGIAIYFRFCPDQGINSILWFTVSFIKHVSLSLDFTLETR